MESCNRCKISQRPLLRNMGLLKGLRPTGFGKLLLQSQSARACFAGSRLRTRRLHGGHGGGVVSEIFARGPSSGQTQGICKTFYLFSQAAEASTHRSI